MTIKYLNKNAGAKGAQMTDTPSLAYQFDKLANQLWDMALPLKVYAVKA